MGTIWRTIDRGAADLWFCLKKNRRTIGVTALSVFALVMFAATLASLPVPVLITIYTAVLITVSVLATSFPVVYQLRSRGLWAKSFTGRVMMMQGTVVGLLLDFTVLGMFRLLPLKPTIVLGIILLIALTLVKLGLLKIVLRIHPNRWFRHHPKTE